MKISPRFDISPVILIVVSQTIVKVYISLEVFGQSEGYTAGTSLQRILLYEVCAGCVNITNF